jgi:hypothetical protein
MKTLKFEVSFEKEEKAFSDFNSYRNVRTDENCYWFGGIERIPQLYESLEQVSKEMFNLFKKHQNSKKTSDARFHIFGYEMEEVSCRILGSIYRYSIYMSWDKVQKAYTMSYGQDQKEIESDSEYMHQIASFPYVKKHLRSTLDAWFKDNVIIEGGKE